MDGSDTSVRWMGSDTSVTWMESDTSVTWMGSDTTQEESHGGGTSVEFYTNVTLLSTLMSER